MRSLLSLDGGYESFPAASASAQQPQRPDKRIYCQWPWRLSSRERNMQTWRLPLLAATVIFGASAALADETQVERGKYLVTIAGCGSCHTPGALLGKTDAKRTLAGSEVGFGIPGVGVFVGGNLTPDKETGLGGWTTEQIIVAITKGVTPNGRKLFPVMPWPDLAHLSSDDVQAIAAYLKSLPPVKNAVPGPFGPKEVPSTLVSVIVPGDVYAKMPAPK
jgi:mono/diheme cytochrome c family protein